MKSLSGGQISLAEVGEASGFLSSEEQALALEISDPRFYRRSVLGGALGFAESYIRGEWDTKDLTALLSVFVRELTSESFKPNSRMSWASNLAARAGHWMRRNTRAGSKKNISAHYDLSNEFFSTMLDETMTYSSACFEQGSTDLAAGQFAKYDRLCRWLELDSSDHLLEIGTGWGGMSIHAATQFGCRVTTTTISQQQYDYATAKIEKLGLTDQINVLLCDYRDLKGTYDKAVSIEMIEAVGHKFLPGYFEAISSLVKTGGQFAIQAISMPDRTYEKYLQRTDFIQKYIFPGSCCPSLGALVQGYSGTAWHCEQIANIGEDYATTLRLWRENFESELPRIRELGFDDRFIRMWRYYLCYCEAGFAEKYLSNHQILFSKGNA